MIKLYCVVYRIGGREWFEWIRTVAMTKVQAQIALANVERQGHTGHVAEYELSCRLGLPETYEVGDPIPGNEV